MAELEITTLLKKMADVGGSDLFIAPGIPPRISVEGKLQDASYEPLTPDDTRQLVKQMLSEEQWADFFQKRELNIAYSLRGIARFRVNVYFQRGTVASVIRRIRMEIPDFAQLNLPPILGELVKARQGLILVTGATGTGKSTTMAAMIDFRAENMDGHIVTIEDPIEFVFNHKKSIITQREVGIDTPNFITALRAALREDPDVIMVGEMRDMDTIATVLQAAETGHLVFSTFHTTDAKETIARIISYFPESQQQQVRSQIAANVIGIISQRLAKRRDKKGLVLAAEVLINTPTIRSAILENRIAEIPMLISKGAEEYSMQTFDQAAVKLFKEGLITEEVGRATATNPSEFDRSIKFTR